MIDLEQLRAELRALTRRKKLWLLLKQELTLLGYWKNKPRGNPKKGWKASQNRPLKTNVQSYLNNIIKYYSLNGLDYF